MFCFVLPRKNWLKLNICAKQHCQCVIVGTKAQLFARQPDKNANPEKLHTGITVVYAQRTKLVHRG